ncbi:MAG: MCE family protein, partial [Actinobacteria bacterium]|nr:MCE family protein [Actinomycetota bacterium]
MAFRRTSRAERPRTLRKDRRGANPVTVGLLVLVAVAAVAYFGFTKDWPFSRGFEFQAVFKTSNSIRLDSPVRIAGVNVGKIKRIEGQDGTNNAVITMEIKDGGLPIHKDARLKIRPRIFLEGNFFVDLQPGTPESPRLSDGDTIPVSQTAGPVQIDQILTSLQQDTRASLRTTLTELGSALTAAPTPEQDASQEPVVRGLTAAGALNSALTYGGPALKSTAVVNEALRGLAADDLSSAVRGLASVGRKLSGSQTELAGLIDNFNTTMAAMAAEQSSLREAVAELGPTVQTAYASLGSLNAALPSVRAFSLEVIPGVEQTPATIAAVTPWIGPAKALL